MLVYGLFLVGFYLLIKGADLLIENAKILGRRFGVSELIIGLTVVAFGTSLPEMVVNLFASFQGNSDLIVGNIVGSNIANTLLILGVAAIIYPLKGQRGISWREIPFGVLAALMVGVLAADRFFEGGIVSQLSFSDGLALLGFFVIFLYATFSGTSEQQGIELPLLQKKEPLLRPLLLIVVGVIGLTLGGQWIVEGATEIANQFGISQTIIGLTIVAIGTSLPELAASAVAAYKRETEIAIGNVVGSNVFNLLFVLGINALVSPIIFEQNHFIDWAVMTVAAILLFVIMFVGRRHTMQRWEGGAFVLLYCAYLTARVWVV